MFSILFAVFGFMLVIMIHETGHFIVSKVLKFKVEEFSIGMGKKLFSFNRGETMYSFRLIPIGGYNKIPSVDKQYVERLSFTNYMRRIAVLVAGSISNILSAIVAVWVIFSLIGVSVDTTQISSSRDGSLLREGDIITSIGGVDTGGRLPRDIFGGSAGKIFAFTRGENSEQVYITSDEWQGMELSFDKEVRTTSFSKGAELSLKTSYGMICAMRDGLASLIGASGREAVTGLSGPIGVASMMYEAKEDIGWHGFLLVWAFISLNIGIVNLLPIPLLDGGRVFTDMVQFITRGRLSEKTIAYSEYAGLTMLIVLFIWGTVGDISRLLS